MRSKILISILVWLGICLPAMTLAESNAVCYDAYGSSTACPGPSESGQTDALYKDNGNGTITDLKSGLVWQQADDGSLRTWQEATAYCQELSFGGISTWRMPDLKELENITEYGRSQNIMNAAFTCQNGNYWTASLSTMDNSKAATVGYSDAASIAYPKDRPYYVRCVSKAP